MKPDELTKIKGLFTPVFEKLGVRKVILFGSRSRGSETRRSDLDIMVVMDTEKRFFDRYEQFEQIQKLIKDRAVDLLIYTPYELDSISHRPFIRRILNEGQTIYEC